MQEIELPTRISNMESTLSLLKDEVVMECKNEIKDELKKELNQEWDVVFKLSTLRDQFAGINDRTKRRYRKIEQKMQLHYH